jgi:hypothetical protein
MHFVTQHIFGILILVCRADPRQNRGAQEAAAIEPPFLWILSFGGAKESISPSGANTRLTHRRDSDLIIFFKPLNDCVTLAS